MSSDEKETDLEGKLSERLPFSIARQDAVLGYLLTNDTFFLQCNERIEPAWFNQSVCQTIWKAKRQYYAQHKKIPTPQDLFESSPVIQGEDMRQKNLIHIKMEQVKFQMAEFNLTGIQSELTEWLHARLFMEGVYAAKDSYNRGQFKSAYTVIEKTIRAIRDSSFDSDVVYDFSNPAAIIERRMANVAKSLTFGHPLIDKLLLPEGNGNGCLLPGASTTLVAPVNIGKTAVMMNIVVPNLRRGKHVLYIPHEGNIDELRLKFLQVVLDRSNGWLIENIRNPDPLVQNHIQMGIRFLDTFLTFMPMIRQGLTVEDVCAAIRRKSEEHVARYGRTFDLVVNDYPAKLTTNEAKEGKMEKRHKDEIIYMALNRIAEEYGWHNLNAIQTNREGSRINRGIKNNGGYEERLLSMEDVAEAWGPMADTSTVFTLNRDPMAKSYNYIILANVKSRTSDTDWAVVCRSKFSCYISHAESLPATWYQGTSVTTPENYTKWVDQFNGQQIDLRAKF